jgi:amino acid transporter
VLIAVAVIFSGKGDWGNLVSTGAVPAEGYLGWLGPFMLSALLGAYTLVGWEAAANMSEETHNPKQVVPRAMVRAVLISGTVGMLFLMVITAGIGDQIEAVTASSSPVALIIENTVGPMLATIMLVVVCVAIFACGLVIMTSNSRLIHAMARDGRIPFAETFAKVPRPTSGPIWATVLAGGSSIAIVFCFITNPDALAALLGAGTLLPAIIYSATVVLFIATRRRYEMHPDDFKLGKWELPVVIGACLWLIIELAIFIIPEDFRVAQYYTLGSIVVGAVVFSVVWKTRRAQLVKEPGLDAEHL